MAATGHKAVQVSKITSNAGNATRYKIWWRAGGPETALALLMDFDLDVP
jgi:hypothetical protein